MPDHIYSGEVNKIWPVSSKTELLHILAVFVLLKGLAGSAEKILLLQAGGAGRGGVLRERGMESCLEKSCWPKAAWPGMCSGRERNFPPSPPQHEGCSPQISPD